ncbi:MAG: efflux RND transporter periplasmic adaptor subunit [marine benthic group bacterium]|nr:efflux RND transporter periplasmic adaptor subunit [Gemmatimonadota bacterium]
MKAMTRNVMSGAALTVAVLAVSAGVVACGTSSADEPAMGLTTVTTEVKDITSAVAATGTIEPIRVIDVKSQASGEVREVGVELGDNVERGALLVRIDPRDVRNAHNQAQADLDVAEARYTVAQRKLERSADLRESQVVTEEEYESALLEEANARAALVKAETNLELAADRLNDVAVGAPIAGTVVEKTVEEGQIITSAKEMTGGTILLRMADLNEVQVRTLVDETDIGVIEPGLQATIKVEAYPDQDFTGTVLQVEPQAVVEQNVTLFAVLTRIQNRQGLLKPGMNADVEIVIGARDGVLALANGGIKTVDEARALVDALGLDTELLQQRVEAQAEGDSATDTPATEADSEAGNSEQAEESGLPSMEQIQAMSQDERREFMQNLSAGERQRMFAMFQEAREARERAERANPASPKPAFVFVETPEGQLTLHPITIGLSDWDYTEIIAGLSEGDVVFQVPQGLVQQSEMLEFMRRRTSMPGMGR